MLESKNFTGGVRNTDLQSRLNLFVGLERLRWQVLIAIITGGFGTVKKFKEFWFCPSFSDSRWVEIVWGFGNPWCICTWASPLLWWGNPHKGCLLCWILFGKHCSNQPLFPFGQGVVCLKAPGRDREFCGTPPGNADSGNHQAASVPSPLIGLAPLGNSDVYKTI